MANPLVEALVDHQDVFPQGELGARLAKSFDHLAQMPRAILLDDLRHPEKPYYYGAHYVGRWLEALSVLSRLEAHRDKGIGIKEAIASLLEFQRPDGLLGEATESDYPAWAAAGLAGLVEAHVTFGYPEALAAATRQMDYFYKSFPRRPVLRACMGIWDIVRYGTVTGDESAFTLARRIYDDCPELGPECPFDQVFGNLFIYIYEHRGLLALCGHTGDEDLLEQARSFHDWATEHAEWVSGGVPEWLSPEHSANATLTGNEDAQFFTSGDSLGLLRDETCTVADWMMFNLDLGLLTGEDHYIAQAEHTFWNHFLYGQAENGGWCAHRDLTGMAGEIWDFCCSYHGSLCLAEAMRYALIRQDDGLRLNLHVPVEARFSWANASVRARIEFDPNRQDYALAFEEGTAGEFPVFLRRPIWAENLRVIAENAQISDAPNGDVLVAKRWHPGDRIACQYSPKVVIHSDATPPVARAAAQRGPLMLVATDFVTKEAETVNVVNKVNSNTRRITVDLDGRFVALVGEMWVKPGLLDWRRPELGFTFSVYTDDETVYGGGNALFLSYLASQILACPVVGKHQLTIEIRSNSSEFPIDAAHVTSLRLFAGDGSMAFLDACLEGGDAPIHRPFLTRKRLVESLSHLDDGWPLVLQSESGSLALQPMKDLVYKARPEAILGFQGPLFGFDSSALLPTVG